MIGALLVSCRSGILPITSEDGGEPLAMEKFQRSTLAVYLASLSSVTVGVEAWEVLIG